MWRRACVVAGCLVWSTGCGSNLGKIEKATAPLSGDPAPAKFQKGLAPMPQGSNGKTPPGGIGKTPTPAPPKPGKK